ncbi:hypothetical protein AXF42_Ash010510 [Apostasia shenzhenica]|uniref:Uncharacterized protein n=1 Tax=Apostasia shenzhenica TaxID=1088818 RepID=A0A2I0A6A2_9ASPA|nr:hypothetical protein AXF42_Ash010510 [Apostasia shenzhenica]
MRSLFDEISLVLPKKIIEILHNVGMSYFLRIPSYKANVPIISVVLSRWDEAVGGFKISHHVILFNPEVISSLIGMSDHGTSFNWVTTYPNLSIVIRDIKDTLKFAVNSTCRDPQQIASLIIKFILSALFFPKNNYSVHSALIECAENFHLVSIINWCKSIYNFLHPFFLPLSQVHRKSSLHDQLLVTSMDSACLSCLRFWKISISELLHTLMRFQRFLGGPQIYFGTSMKLKIV